MAAYTNNYHLKKPDAADFVDIQDLNGNADQIDAALHETAEDLQRLNESAESFMNETNTALGSLSDGKVDKVPGKVLSSNDYTTAEKNKLAGINRIKSVYRKSSEHWFERSPNKNNSQYFCYVSDTGTAGGSLCGSRGVCFGFCV